MKTTRLVALLAFGLWAGAAILHAQGLNPSAQARLDKLRDEAVQWAADPIVVEAVLHQNRSLSPELEDMTQEKWEALPAKASLIQKFIAHPAAQLLRDKGATRITEAFLSDAQGRKIAFLGKTTSWSHLGKPKHDVPMSGKFWQGKLETDRSAGTQQIQISVPVLAEGTPVGSLVIGVPVSTLASE